MKRIVIALMVLLLAAPMIADEGRGYVGVTIAAVETQDGDGPDGVYIQEVFPGTGAEAEGVAIIVLSGLLALNLILRILISVSLISTRVAR